MNKEVACEDTMQRRALESLDNVAVAGALFGSYFTLISHTQPSGVKFSGPFLVAVNR